MAPGPDWRFVVTELGNPQGDGRTITILDRLARNREILKTLDQGSVANCSVPSDNPEVNGAHRDGDPFVSYGNRQLYGLRREGQPLEPIWKCRFAGTIMQLEDEAQADQASTHITAYDPWQLLMARPLTRLDGKLPVNGLSYNLPGQAVKTLDQIALDLLQATDLHHGPTWIDFGQIGEDVYIPHIETVGHPAIQFTQGISVGEAWTQLCDTGQLDIVLTPIYDPTFRPGYLAELRIYARVGQPRYNAIFAWDKPSRSLVGVNRLLDGTQIANKVQFYKSDGQSVDLEQNNASIVKYGEYWLQKSLPDQAGKRATELLAIAELLLRQRGRETLTVDPIAERSPVPFLDYVIGDLVPVYSSDRFRDPIVSDPANPLSLPGLWRVYAIPLSIADDGVETVQKLLLTSPSTDL